MPSSEPLPPSESDRSEADRGGAEELTFEQELAEVERSLQALKQRYHQVEQDQQEQAQLQHRRDQLPALLPAAQPELKQIQSRLDELEFNLESRLFTWGSLKEPFWQIIRFGGLGMVVGWFLAFTVLKQPQPMPESTPATSSSQQP